jgi:diguanylate cyclase (GGDEF)-like protein/PAS domain S-box-containing protein
LESKNFKNSGSEGQITSRWQSDPAGWAQHILSCIEDAIIITDISDRINYLNPAAERMTGWSVQEVLGRPMAEVMKIIDVATHESPRHLTEAPINQDGAAYLAANRILIRRDGTETVIEDSVTPIHDQEGRATGAVIVLRALTEEAKAKALKMSHLAQYDGLTDLPNRTVLKDRLSRALALATRYSRSLAMLFVDLDHFKQVNDSAGHAIGDRVLQSTAGRLLACVRSSDTVSRYGGDEFVILLPEIDDSRNLMPVAKKILAAIAVPHNLEPHVFHITASIGVSIFPQHGRDGETLIQNADAAMYWVKQHGRNNIQFFDGRLKLKAASQKCPPTNSRTFRRMR